MTHYLQTLTYAASGAVSQDTIILGPLDCASYRGISINVSALGTDGAIAPEWSNDSTNWTAGPVTDGTGAFSATGLAAAGIYVTPQYGAWFRLRVSTAITGGNTAIQVARTSDSLPLWAPSTGGGGGGGGSSGGLTNTELRASAVSVSPNITRGGGAIDSNTQRVTLATDGPGVAALTSIDSKAPALVSGRVPVDPAVTKSSGAIDANTQRVTLATDSPGVSALTSLDTKAPALVSGRVPVDPAMTKNSGAIDANTQRVTLATNSPGVSSLTSIDGKLAVPRTPTTTSVASSATSVTILAANTNRRGLSIYNASTAVLNLSFSTPATTANSFVQLPAGAFILLDTQLIITNAVYGIWASANGTAQVTEYV